MFEDAALWPGSIELTALNTVVKADRVVEIELDELKVVRADVDGVDERTEVALESIGQIVGAVVVVLAADVVVARHIDLSHVPVLLAASKGARETLVVALELCVVCRQALVEQIAQVDDDVRLHVRAGDGEGAAQVAIRVPASEPVVVPRLVVLSNQLRIGDEQEAQRTMIALRST